MSVDKLRLIEEVRKRPKLWKREYTSSRKVNKLKLWEEVGQILDADVSECKRIWHTLRSNFAMEKIKISRRIEKAKKDGRYNPQKIYIIWNLYDALRFIDETEPEQPIQADMQSTENENSNVFSENKSSTYSSPEPNNCPEGANFVGGNTFFKEEPEFQLQSDLHSTENVYVFKENKSATCLAHEGANFDSATTLLKQEPEFKIKADLTAADNESINVFNVKKSLVCSVPEPNDCVEDANFVSGNTFFKEDRKIKTEADLASKENIVVFNENKSSTYSSHEPNNCVEDVNFVIGNTFLKEEPEFQLESDLHSTENDNNCVEAEFIDQSTASEEHFKRSPDINDDDYSFLYSFLSQTKLLSQSQKMEFRIKMKTLLLHISPASSSVDLLENQLLLPVDDDPDKKFLLSFWPFMKSMPLIQNLQFRAKMAQLVLNCISAE